MRDRIEFLRRVMDEVHRQPAPGRIGQVTDHEEEDAELDLFSASGATPIQPLQIFLDVEILRTQLADALQALRMSEERICTSPARRIAWERALRQRRQFLNWLNSAEGGRVFLAMYPEERMRREE
jgi:hypothetical protein